MPDANLPQRRKKHTGFHHSHAFVIGINQYPIVDKPLKSAVPDAWKLATVLWEKQGFDHVWLMINPGFKEINDLLNWLKDSKQNGLKNLSESSVFPVKVNASIQNAAAANKVKDHIFHADNFAKAGNQKLCYHYHHQTISTDTSPPKKGSSNSLVFYYAGHGQAGKYDEGPSGYLLPMDVSNNAELSNKIPMESVKEALEILDCKHSLLILDCCFAGKFKHAISKNRVFQLGERRPITEERFERFKRKMAWQVLVSAGPDQTAADWISERNHIEVATDDSSTLRLPHSPFAKALFQALDGAADFKHMGQNFGDGVITATELKLYLFDQVEQMTKEDPNFKIQHPDLFEMKRHEGGEFIFINPNAPDIKFAKWQQMNPYKGLTPYEPIDWPFFFGRKTAIQNIEKKLQKSKVLLISAPSGIGKSSLIKAGLFPKFEREGYHIFTFQPGEHPLLGEKIEIKENEKVKQTYWSGLLGLENELLQFKHKKKVILFDQFEGIFQGKPLSTKEQQKFDEILAILIGKAFKWQLDRNEFDQLILGPKENQEGWEKAMDMKWAKGLATEKQQDLAQLMKKALKKQLSTLDFVKLKNTLADTWDQLHPDKIILLFTLRSDFEWNFENSIVGKEMATYSKKIAEGKSYSMIFRPAPMGLDELREALISPALIRGFEFESEELVDDILEEIGYAPAALPLLSLSMNTLFEIAEKEIKKTGSDQRVFTRKMYEEQLGGITGALNKLADQFYKNLQITPQPEQSNTAELPASPKQELMKKIFLRMLQLNDGEYTSRKVYFNKLKKGHELDFPKEIYDGSIWDFLEEMAKAQLIVIGEGKNDQNFIIPAHDTLLNHWNKCREWIQAFGRENLLLQQQLWQAVLDERLHQQNENNDQARNMVEAKAIDPSTLQEDVLTSDSAFWDHNSKLQQLIQQTDFIVDGKPLDPFRDIRPMEEEELNRLLAKFSKEELTVILNHSKHWFNKAEIRFIIESWDLKNKRHQTLAAERDAALAGKKAAEATTITAFARMLPEIETPNILKLLEAAWTNTLPDAPPSIVSRDLTHNFLKQWDESGEVVLPFYNLSIASEKDRVFSGHCLLDKKDMIFTVSEKTNNGGLIDPIIKIWDTNNCELVYEKKDIETGVFTFDKTLVSPNQQYIICYGSDIFDSALWNNNEKTIIKFPPAIFAFFISDGAILIMNPKQILIIDLEGNVITEFEGIENNLFSMDWNAEKEWIIAASLNEVKRWNKEGKLLQTYTFDANTPVIQHVKFSPNGEYIFIMKNGVHQVLNIKGELQPQFKQLSKKLIHAVFSPDGKYILTSSHDQNQWFYLWNMKGEKIKDLSYIGQPFKFLFSPDSKLIITVYGDQKINIWYIDGPLIRTIDYHKDGIRSVKFSADSKKILTSSFDKTIKYWKLQPALIKDYRTMFRFKPCSFPAEHALSANGQFILSNNRTNGIDLWDIEGKLIKELNQGDEENHILNISYSPTHQFLITASLNKTKLWNTNGEFIADLPVLKEKDYHVVFSPDEELLLIANLKNIYLYTTTGTLIKQFEQDKTVLSRFKFSPDSQRWVIYGLRINLLLDRAGNQVFDLNQPVQQISDIIFSDQEATFISYDRRTKNIQIRQSTTGILIKEMKPKVPKNQYIKRRTLKDKSRSLLISPDQQVFISLSESGRVHLWRITGEKITDLDEKIETCYFSTNGKMIITHKDEKAKLWNIEEASYIELKQEKEQKKLKSFVFSPDNQFILGINQEKNTSTALTTEAVLWDKEGNVIKEIKSHLGNIKSACFSADSQYLLTASTDKTAKLWNIDGALLADFNKHENELVKAVFSPDEQFVYTITAYGSVRRYPVPARIYNYLKDEAGLSPLNEQKIEEYGLTGIIEQKHTAQVEKEDDAKRSKIIDTESNIDNPSPLDNIAP